METTDTPEAPAAAREATDLVPTLEALLFVSAEPVTLRQMQGALPGTSRELVHAALDLLRSALLEDRHGIQLQEVAGGYRLATKPEQEAFVRSLAAQKKKQKLSPAARETLSIVAYKQPMTAPEITEIRGVDCTSALKSLLERKLIRILGRKEVVGRPILYGTTREFLVQFGLKGLEELPTLEEFEDLAAGMDVSGGTGEGVARAPADAGEVQDLVLAKASRDARELAAEDEEGPETDDAPMGEEE